VTIGIGIVELDDYDFSPTLQIFTCDCVDRLAHVESSNYNVKTLHKKGHISYIATLHLLIDVFRKLTC